MARSTGLTGLFRVPLPLNKPEGLQAFLDRVGDQVRNPLEDHINNEKDTDLRNLSFRTFTRRSGHSFPTELVTCLKRF